MSTQKKRAFQIEAFKHRVVVDPKYAEKTWKVLEHAIHEIYNHNASGLSFEELYRNAYNMVLHKFGEKLYTGLVTTMTAHLKEISQSIESAQGEIFLDELNRKWVDHNKALQMIRDILMYMDRTFIPSNHKTPVHELGLNLWRDVVIHSSKTQARLLDTLLELVLRERNGEVINRGLMRNIIKMLMDLGLPVYQHDFEKHFLDVSANFYCCESQKFIETCDCGDYLKKAERRLNEELERVSHYLDPRSESKITNVVEKVTRTDNREIKETMESIVHRTVEVNGIKMHVAEKGEGPVVLFLHGFPELWYSWRHQILHLSSLGYRAVAPDLRGYGDSDAPAPITAYTCFHLLGDIVALIDSLGVDKVFLVGHDWGAILGWYLCLFRPDRVKAYVCLSVPFRPFLGRNPQQKTVDMFRALYGEDYYICRFQEPGKMEAELGRVDTGYLMKNILTTRHSGPPIFPKGEYGTGFNPHTPDILPSWLTQQDLDYFVTKFKKSGFTGGLNYYRNLNLNWELTAAWTGVGIENVPVKFIIGSVDLVYNSQGMKEYIHNGGFKKDVPSLEEVVVQEGVGHFNNQEAAHDVANHIHHFINKF